MNQNKVLSGTDGTAFINGEILGELSGIELKVAGKFEEFSLCGDPATYQKFVGYGVEGSLKFQKTNSRGIRLLADAYKSGIMPDIKIITKLTDKTTGNSERTSVDGVVFTEFSLAKYEKKGLIEEELPLKASNYDILETL